MTTLTNFVNGVLKESMIQHTHKPSAKKESEKKPEESEKKQEEGDQEAKREDGEEQPEVEGEAPGDLGVAVEAFP
jgi:hypothetical protein